MAPKRRNPPPPLKSNNSTMKITSKPNMTNKMTQSLADGFMFGTGSSLGRHAVNSILATSPSGSAPTSTPTPIPVSTDNTSCILPETREAECMKYVRKYQHCLCEFDNTCQEYMDQIQKYCN